VVASAMANSTLKMKRTAESTSGFRPSARNCAVNFVIEVINPREMITETVPANHWT
jgi:hypothetical protein